MSLLRTDKEISDIYERQWQTVWRVCFSFLKNRADTEDAVQETFLRLIRYAPELESPEHEKAWLIRTAANVCKNELKHWWRKREDIGDYEERAVTEEPAADETLLAVMELPEKYKTAVYLYYYEGYSGKEIAAMLQKPASTVRNRLRAARALLRERLGEFDEE